MIIYLFKKSMLILTFYYFRKINDYIKYMHLNENIQKLIYTLNSLQFVILVIFLSVIYSLFFFYKKLNEIVKEIWELFGRKNIDSISRQECNQYKKFRKIYHINLIRTSSLIVSKASIKNSTLFIIPSSLSGYSYKNFRIFEFAILLSTAKTATSNGTILDFCCIFCAGL